MNLCRNLCFVVLIHFASNQDYVFGFTCARIQLKSTRLNNNVKNNINEIDSSFSISSSPPSSSSLSLTGDDDLRKDLLILKARLEKLEKISSSSKSFFDLSNLFDGKSIGLNKRTIEICSIFSFFIIGSLLSRTIFDGLWFVGGLLTAWWASVAINTSTSAGTVVRRVGIQLAQFIMDIQEKVNQAYIFYRTGKLAYHSSKIWEAIDQSYDVTTRVDMFKRFAMIRAAEVNNFLGEKKYTDQLHDFWKALVSVPFEARRINVEYGLTSKVFKFGRHVTSSVRNFALDLVSGTGISTGYIAPPVVPAKPTRRSTKRKTKSSPSSLTSMGLEAVKKVQSVVEQLLSSGGESPSDRARKRGQVINPWVPFWAYLSKYPTRKRNGRWALQ